MVKNPLINSKFWSQDADPDLDNLRGEPSHGYNRSCVKTIRSIGAIVFELFAQTDKQTKIHYPRTPLRERG